MGGTAPGGSSAPVSAPSDGPLLAGMTVTVFPGGSSRASMDSVTGPAGSGWKIVRGSAWGMVDTGIKAAGTMLGSTGAEGRGVFSGGRLVVCRGARSRSSSTREAISSRGGGIWICRMRSRSGTDVAGGLISSEPQRIAAISIASGSSKTLRIGSPRVQCWPVPE
jgi:hypothetical protein